ncbi:hypothetical protein C489_08050 [Natrinema versiforme JCM 10478]|uniref:Uncharacterized protein n=2 Tax=Natrinema versiforme TaxID=88724 RepID=L9Y2K7_9EURY|nr:hypothetical protein C489_08050 [Natrinema versiforme JCM 10478]
MAAVALLGVWALMTLWATGTAAAGQSRIDEQFGPPDPDTRRGRPDGTPDDRSSEPSFSAADD